MHSQKNIRLSSNLLESELQRFDRDYSKHCVQGVSNPPEIGRPYLLHCPGAKTGVLLVHGLMAAPEEVRLLAEHFYGKGFSVYAPRLAGHGTSPKDLASKVMDNWVESVEIGRVILDGYCDKVILAGFSTGAALALHEVTRQLNDFEAVIAISAPLKLKSFAANFVSPLHGWNRAMQALGLARLAKPYATNHPDNPHINYTLCPISGLVEIKKIMRKVVENLHSIRIPTLVIHATEDPKVDIHSARAINKALSGCVSELHEIDFDMHGIIRGDIRHEVFSHIDQFLARHLEMPSSDLGDHGVAEN